MTSHEWKKLDEAGSFQNKIQIQKQRKKYNLLILAFLFFILFIFSILELLSFQEKCLLSGGIYESVGVCKIN